MQLDLIVITVQLWVKVPSLEWDSHAFVIPWRLMAPIRPMYDVVIADDSRRDDNGGCICLSIRACARRIILLCLSAASAQHITICHFIALTTLQ